MNQEITAQGQGNYPNFKQNLTERENFVISEVSESQPLFNKYRLRAARFQELTTRASSKEIESGKKLAKSRGFSISSLRKLD